MRRTFLAALFLLALTPAAFAGSTTMGVKDASGTSHNFDIGTDGSGNYFPWLALCDGVAAAQCATVKAASTAAAAADLALVVGLSPNSPLPAGSNTIGAVTQASGPWSISATSLPLPTGAASAANQTSVQGVVGAGTAPADMAVGGGIYNSTLPTLTTGQSAALQLDASGRLLVDGSGVTQPVSGTLAATQSGIWTVQPGNTANTTAWLFNLGDVNGSAAAALSDALANPTTFALGSYSLGWDATNSVWRRLQVDAGTGVIKVDGSAQTQPVSGTFWQATQPVSAAALPLPTGAATAANQTAAQGATGSAAPASAIQAGAVSSGNLVGIIQADNSAAINVSTATTTQLVALSAGKKIYVTNLNVIAGGTGNITFEYGTGTTCGTGTTALTGAYNLTAQTGLAMGGGLGPVLVVPAGDALCVLTSAAVQMSGSIAFTQF